MKIWWLTETPGAPASLVLRIYYPGWKHSRCVVAEATSTDTHWHTSPHQTACVYGGAKHNRSPSTWTVITQQVCCVITLQSITLCSVRWPWVSWGAPFKLNVLLLLLLTALCVGHRSSGKSCRATSIVMKMYNSFICLSSLVIALSTAILNNCFFHQWLGTHQPILRYFCPGLWKRCFPNWKKEKAIVIWAPG